MRPLRIPALDGRVTGHASTPAPRRSHSPGELDQVFRSLRNTKFSFAQIHALTILGRLHGRTIILSGLARELGVSTGAVTNIVDKLESLHLASRVLDPHDRRKTLVAISDEGSRFLAHLAECLLGRPTGDP